MPALYTVFIKIKIEYIQTVLFEKKVVRNCLKDQFQLYIIKTRRKIKDKQKKLFFFWNSNLLQFCLYVVKSSIKFLFTGKLEIELVVNNNQCIIFTQI